MDSNEKIARDSSLNMNQRLEAIEALCADEAGGEVASQVVLDCLRSDSFESKFLGLICAYRFSNSVEIKGIIQKLASWPSQEPFEIRKQAVCALATTDCEMTASKLQGYLNHCEECCAVSWNRCIIRLANRLTSAEAERFLRSVIYDADFSAYIEDAQVGMVRLGDPLAIDWAVRCSTTHLPFLQRQLEFSLPFGLGRLFAERSEAKSRPRPCGSPHPPDQISSRRSQPCPLWRRPGRPRVGSS